MAQVFPRILASFAHKSLQANQVVLDPYTEYLTHGALMKLASDLLWCCIRSAHSETNL